MSVSASGPAILVLLLVCSFRWDTVISGFQCTLVACTLAVSLRLLAPGAAPTHLRQVGEVYADSETGATKLWLNEQRLCQPGAAARLRLQVGKLV